MSVPVLVYMSLSSIFPVALNYAARRAHRRMQAPSNREQERFGRSTAPRPIGKVIWIHGASIGEISSVIDIANRLNRLEGISVLLTTTTNTAAEIVTSRVEDGILHQFPPVDTKKAVTEFLNFWKPNLVAFVEGDFWPRMLATLHSRGVPTALLNVRESRSRHRFPKTTLYFAKYFSMITAQSQSIGQDLLTLGVDENVIEIPGDLKAAQAAPNAHKREVDRYSVELSNRRVWAAVSTHGVENDVVLNAHRKILKEYSDALLILVPRHPEHFEVSEANSDWSIRKRTERKSPGLGNQVWLFDTIGETGLVYRLVSAAFIGGSIVAKGGHNPFEAALLGVEVFHGKDTRHFATGYESLRRQGLACRVNDENELSDKILERFRSKRSKTMDQRFKKWQENHSHAQDKTLTILTSLLNQQRPLEEL